jgi:hypothetical protein
MELDEGRAKGKSCIDEDKNRKTTEDHSHISRRVSDSWILHKFMQNDALFSATSSAMISMLQVC